MGISPRIPQQVQWKFLHKFLGSFYRSFPDWRHSRGSSGGILIELLEEFSRNFDRTCRGNPGGITCELMDKFLISFWKECRGAPGETSEKALEKFASNF